MENQNSKLAIPVEDMGKRLGIGRVVAYRLANSEGFPSIRVGGRILIPVRELEAWLADQAKKGSADGRSV